MTSCTAKQETRVNSLAEKSCTITVARPGNRQERALVVAAYGCRIESQIARPVEEIGSRQDGGAKGERQ